MHSYIRKINYYETDQMHIVHHSNHVRYCEEARLAHMESYGLGYDEVERLGLIIPVLYANVKYIKPLHYGDTIRIDTYLTRFNGVKLDYTYKGYNVDTGELLFTAQTGHAVVDPYLKPLKLKKVYPDLYKKLTSVCEKEIAENEGALNS
ncbi:MAG: acyl-CoA thioesterase [Lachnospiraceae bacterium]|jgi:acyl-CoA thioester hydrolase|nr:acyl-CoA thioesterase [Lachnospiraceae bacterium]MEE3461925.1 acyl-CoA thioesterase [Lachnospiraceae bacterium]